MDTQQLLIVSNRLPVTLADDGTARRSSGGLVSALDGLPAGQFETNWLGWPGIDVAPDRQAELADLLRREHACTPVFVPRALADAHYEGLSNSSLWPLLHYLPSYFRYEPDWWDAYRQVNRVFADRVIETARPGAVVWVHDYQLMLLPRLLRTARPDLRIGFFLHTPFPSGEVFRCQPHHDELLDGLLGADLCGFHTFGYLRHFRSAVTHALSVNAEMMSLRHDTGRTRLGVFPIGIAAPAFERTLASPEFLQQFAALASEHGDKKLILSVERLDYSKGIPNRLQAIDLFLSGLDEAERDRVKFMFISIPTREGVDAYRDLRTRVEHQVGLINGRYATLRNSPLHFIHGSVAMDQLCGLYALADVCLVTPLRDGMNLVAKEYVACQTEIAAPAEAVGGASSNGHGQGNGRPGADPHVLKAMPGVLVLSEFTGAAEELFNAIQVNPYDVAALADAIREALAMPEAERRRRMARMRSRVLTYDARAWAADFLDELAGPGAPAPSAGVDLPHDTQARLAAALGDGRDVAMFLDYDGTLREHVAEPVTAQPTAEVRRLLDRLHDTPGLDVTIISGRSPQDLERFLGPYQRFALVAEHGAAIRPSGGTEWERMDLNLTDEWKQSVLKILRHYERSTPGSHVEDKHTSLVWHYRRADAEFGAWRARQLAEDLSVVAANEPVEIRHGARIVEVVGTRVNKGTAVQRALQERQYDLVLLAGDDTTDESMFRMDLPEERTLTIRVGWGETRAKTRVASPRALRTLLHGALDASHTLADEAETTVRTGDE
jgi:trehalose 6-phosphate synthase/phosphatase